MFRTELVEMLSLRMRQTTDELLSDGKRASSNGRYNYSGKSHNVLGVAHCDYVIWGYPTLKDGKMYGGQVDDRVGVWILLDVLPSMGIEFDFLLTNDEEVGRSSAKDFAEDCEHEDISYSWAFQFDRKGTDCVHYGNSKEWDGLISKDFKLGMGTYSDVAELPCRHINVGCGYYHEHTDKAFVDLKQCWAQVQRFKQFYAKHKDKEFEPIEKYTRSFGGYYGRYYDDSFDLDDYLVGGFNVPALE